MNKFLFNITLLLIFATNISAEPVKLEPWTMIKVKVDTGSCAENQGEAREVISREVIFPKNEDEDIPNWIMPPRPTDLSKKKLKLGAPKPITIKETYTVCWDGYTYECVPQSVAKRHGVKLDEVSPEQICHGT